MGAFNDWLKTQQSQPAAPSQAEIDAKAKQEADQALRAKVGYLPISASPMDLGEIRASWPSLEAQRGKVFTDAPGQSYQVREGGSSKGYHPRAIVTDINPKTGQKTEYRYFYTVPEGAQLPAGIATEIPDPFNVEKLLVNPFVIKEAEKWEFRGKPFNQLSGEERNNALRDVAMMLRDKAYRDAFPNHTIASMVSNSQNGQGPVEYMPGNAVTSRARALAGAFQNGLSGINAVLPFELVPGMDSERTLAKAYSTFQHLGTKMPSHPSTIRAVDRLISGSDPSPPLSAPAMRWVPVMPDVPQRPHEAVQLKAEQEAEIRLKQRRKNGDVFKAMDGSMKPWDALSDDDKKFVAHDTLREEFAKQINDETAYMDAWRQLQGENSRPVQGGGIMMDAAREITGFLPTAAAMYATGGLSSAAGATATAAPITHSVAAAAPFIAQNYQSRTGLPQQIIEQAAADSGLDAMSKLRALQRINDAAAAGKGMSYEDARSDAERRGLGAAAGTAIAAPVAAAAGSALNNLVARKVAPKMVDTAYKYGLFNRPSIAVTGTAEAMNKPMFLMTPGAGQQLARGVGNFAAQTAISSGTMPIFPIFERAGESAVALDAAPITDISGIANDIKNYAAIGATFAPYNWAHGKLNQFSDSLKDPKVPGPFVYNPRHFVDPDPFIYPKSSATYFGGPSEFNQTMAPPVMVDPFMSKNGVLQNQVIPEGGQVFTPFESSLARDQYYKWLQGLFKLPTATPSSQPQPQTTGKPGLGGSTPQIGGT